MAKTITHAEYKTITHAEYKTIEEEAEQLTDGCFAFAKGHHIEVLKCATEKVYNVMVTVFTAPDVTGPDSDYTPSESDFVDCVVYSYGGQELIEEIRIEDLAKQKFLNILASYMQ